MNKVKIYDIQDTNLALFGSDTEKKVKKNAAQTEPAWNGTEKEGFTIWRIVKFKVTPWDKKMYGKFYNGDSYLVLNVYKKTPKAEELSYDLHFWIGAYSTADEYGTAAYKTVELDTYLDDRAIQYREIQGNESALFNSYFKEIVIMNGGAESGFNHVKPEEYIPRLLHFHGLKNNIQVVEVPASQKSLDVTDVFILDEGLMINIWYGSQCNTGERTKARSFANTLASERGKAKTVVFESGDDGEFRSKLSNEAVEKEAKYEHKNDQMLKVSNESGKVEYTDLGVSKIARKYLDTNDVFIVNHCSGVYVWVGKKANQCEKRNGISYAQSFIHGIPDKLKPVTIVKEGRENDIFQSLF